uniref:Uncharacterized protein n=1 Tax=Arundo donax TaxID=35708 RepID=A0A0A8YW36_ARUDO
MDTSTIQRPAHPRTQRTIHIRCY